MATPSSIHRLEAGASTLVFDLRAGHAELGYFGPALPLGDDLAALCDALRRGPHEAQPDRPVPRSVLPLGGTRHVGAGVIEAMRNGRMLELDPGPVTAGAIADARTDPDVDADTLRLETHAAPQGVRVRSEWRAHDSGVVTAETSVTNGGHDGLTLLRCAALALPVPRWAHTVVSFSGRWSSELHARRTPLSDASGLGARTHGGRPGFSGAQWIVFESHDSHETAGLCLAVHLAWSGDHEWGIDLDADGDAMLLVGPRLRPGDVTLQPSESFRTPRAVLALGTEGRASLRHLLHRHVIEAVLPSLVRDVPRKVHLNTWEACGFDLSLPRLEQLATRAAELGVERFVLDDGWFAGRRDDTSSLGDWCVSEHVFPDGLDPLIRHVHRLGMDFGLWVEPEMVSPDSALYRSHPDWCLHDAGLPRATQRHQLVLDLTRPEVADHVFASLDTLLQRHAIAYLKWDHNRDLFPLAGQGVAQTEALYRLLDRVRSAHPALEIESCASGGGRVDHAILARCTRFWPSDNNEAIERLRMMRSWLQFLPLCAYGSHVGPSPNPITGRVLPMDFRAKVALFGHMGVEADPDAMDPDERTVLAAHIALYKAWREVLHAGDLHEIPCDDPGVSGWLAVRSDRALALVAQTGFARHFEVAPVRLPGLDPSRRYRVHLPEPWPSLAARYLAEPESWRTGVDLSGQALMHAGLALPLRHPATAWLIALEAR